MYWIFVRRTEARTIHPKKAMHVDGGFAINKCKMIMIVGNVCRGIESDWTLEKFRLGW